MRKKCRRKVYQLVNPIQYALEGAAIVEDNLILELRIKELNAIDSMVKGTGTVDDWLILNEMMNLSEVMSKSGIGKEVFDVCNKAQQELMLAAKRFEKTGKMGLTGQGIQIMRDLYQYHDIQRKSISRAEYEKAIQKTINLIKGKSKNVVQI